MIGPQTNMKHLIFIIVKVNLTNLTYVVITT